MRRLLADLPSIRRLTPLDATWLSLLHQEAFETPWSATSFADLLSAPTVRGWTAETPVGPGFILTQATPLVGEILTFQVAKSARSRGLGRHVLHHAMVDLQREGIESVFLEVAATRLTAKKLYENQGFRLEGRRKNYYKTRAGRSDAEVWALHF